MSGDNSQNYWRGKTAIVSGAASGVGAAACALLAADGARLVMLGRDGDKLRRFAASLGAESETLAGDVGDSAFCDAAVRRAEERFGGLALLINSAGVIHRATAANTGDDDWRRVMRANADGVFYLSRAAARLMCGRREGAIVNIASTLALVGAAGLAAYCASKGAVAQLTRAMALECAASGVTINAVCPGAIDSPMLYSAHADGVTNDAVREKNEKIIPTGALATAAGVARAALFLAREPHITGALLSADGGYVAQ